MNYLLYALAYLWAFWAIYVLVMGLYRAYLAKRLTPLTIALSVPILAVGYAMDALTNLTLASLIFAEPPREVLVTTRLKRHIAESAGWRFVLALYVCDNLLDVFDPTGDHC